MTDEHDNLDTNDSLEAVGDFLTIYYYDESDDVVAASDALEETLPRMEYRWQLACAFREVLARAWPAETLKELVRHKANRFARSDAEAREFLQKTYNLNLFELAVDIEKFKREGGRSED
ncbi:MAG TPA: hypothetical protein VGW12_13995 [Pyrinomonadaceae bacterium]|nr:hypothetical protein [Pyrinomonadaceae bacterium]